ncbi:MAG: hypothetical protein ACIAXF_04025 [Phycisphaerales bacterium JB063]
MPFTSGRVSFARFHVSGDTPPAVDETFLELLHEHRFRETEIGAPDEVEAGFVTAEHLFDTQFTFEKVAYGRYALFSLRIDTHKVPAEVKKAYQKMNEAAAAGASPTGFASKQEKREAKELAGRQVSEDLAAGRFRKSKSVQMVWDLPGGTVYSANASNAVTEQLVRLMRQAFNIQLEPLSSGTLAGLLLSEQGRSRDYEDISPSAFTKPPAETGPRDEEDDGMPQPKGTPICPWVTKSIDLKDFLGNEFLTWLWWHCEVKEGIVETEMGELFVTITKTLDMDCAWEIGGKQTLRCDKPTSLPEADDALRTGKWPRKVGLLLSDGEHHWELTLQGDQLNTSAAQLPDIEDAQTDREVTEQRLALTGALSRSVNALYAAFLKQRTATGWAGKRETISAWIKQRHTKPQPAVSAAPVQTAAS